LGEMQSGLFPLFPNLAEGRKTIKIPATFLTNP